MTSNYVGKPTNTLTWSDGTAFSGYVRILTSFPDDYDQAFKIADHYEQMLPQDYILPVSHGVINNNLAVWYNSEISPFGTTYAWEAYDSTFRKIAGPSASFTVSTASFTLPSLTIPTQTPPPTMPLNTNTYYEFPGGDNYTPDLANGQFQQIYLNRVTTTIAAPIYTGGTLVPGQTLTLIFWRDNASSSTQRNVVMHSDYLWASGSIDDSGFLILPSGTNVQNIATFVYQPTLKWLNTSWLSGVPRS